MKALTQEMEAKVIEAESEIPLAIAESLHTSRLTIMDYYRLRNLVADTDMRRAIAESSLPEGAGSRKLDFSTV